MDKKEKIEKRILWLSFTAGLLFAVAELIFSIFSHSQSVLMDAVYDATELIFIALILFLTPLFYRPVSEKHPYGYFQVESIFIIIKGFMMLSVTLGVSVEVVEAALSGGNSINEVEVAAFQLLLGFMSVVIYLALRKMNQKLSSPTVDTELMEWRLDIAYSLGMSLAFYGSTFLKNTPLSFLAPYFDPIVAVLVIILMLPQNMKLLWNAIKDVFLFSPDEETVGTIKEICIHIMREAYFHPVFFDITRTGRHLWIAVYFEIEEDILSVTKLRDVSDCVNREISEKFEDCTCELILASGGDYALPTNTCSK